MEWVTNLKGKTIGLDTAPLIYFIEEHPTYLETILNLFEAVERGEVTPQYSNTGRHTDCSGNACRSNDARLSTIPSLEILVLDDVIKAEIK